MLSIQSVASRLHGHEESTNIYAVYR